MIKVIPTGVDLVRIEIYIRYMPVERYVQFASSSHGGSRRYVDRGSAGGLSISAKNCTILACGIDYFEDGA